MNQYDILIKPINTEKSNLQREMYNQYSFEVHPFANRLDIKNALQRIFGVKVKAVNTINMKGKVKRRGKILGKRKNWKKAIVSLEKNEKIDFFDGV